MASCFVFLPVAPGLHHASGPRCPAPLPTRLSVSRMPGPRFRAKKTDSGAGADAGNDGRAVSNSPFSSSSATDVAGALRELADQLDEETMSLKEQLAFEERRRSLAELNLKEVTKQFDLARSVREEMEEGKFGAMDEVIGQFRASLNASQLRAAKAERELEDALQTIKLTRREANSFGADRWQLAAVFALFFLLLLNYLLHSEFGDEIKLQLARYLTASI